MSGVGSATRMTKCLFCHKRKLYEYPENWLSKIMETQLIAICQTYLPKEFVDFAWDNPLCDGPIFCFWCFNNANKLSRLNTKLQEIKETITSLVEQFTSFINVERERQRAMILTKTQETARVTMNKPISEVPTEIEVEDVHSQIKPIEEQPEITLEVECIDIEECPSTLKNVQNEDNHLTTLDVPGQVLLTNTSAKSRRKQNFKTVEMVSFSCTSTSTTNNMIMQDFDSVIANAIPGTKLEKSHEYQQDLKRFAAEAKGSNSKTFRRGPEFHCAKCNKKFSWFRTLRKHDCNRETVECDVCGKSFTRRYFENHKLLHLGKVGFGTYQCHVCNKSFKLKSEWVSHTEANHFDNMPYKCDICKIGFMFAMHWRTHKKIHEDDRQFKCKLCPVALGFKTIRQLKQHFRYKHERFKCSACQMYCEDDAAFRTHLQSHRNSKSVAE